MSWDPYVALGVSRNASAEDIRKAYRKLAKELHPDVRPNDAASEERFKRVTAAFNLLSDGALRERFDRGEIDADGNEQPQFHAGGFGAGRGGRTGRPDGFEDLFEGLFGRNTTSRGFGPMRGEDVRYRMEIDFLDAVNGGRRRVVMSDSRPLDISIPAGVESGQTLRLKGQGNPGLNGGPAGDALVEVTVGSHQVFRREGHDIRMDLRISLAEAIEGGRVTVVTPSGSVAMNVPPGSNSGDVLRLRGKGVQTRPAAGDLFVRLLIVLPAGDNGELKSLLADWSRRAETPPR